MLNMTRETAPPGSAPPTTVGSLSVGSLRTANHGGVATVGSLPGRSLDQTGGMPHHEHPLMASALRSFLLASLVSPLLARSGVTFIVK